MRDSEATRPAVRLGRSALTVIRSWPAARLVGPAVLVALCGLLLAALFEDWLGLLFGRVHIDAIGVLVSDGAHWPNTVKTALYLLVAGLTAAKFTLDGRWGQLRTRADLALVVLGVVLVVAGVFGPSTPKLIAAALFVYLRGAVAFYALRALDPSRAQIRRVLYLLTGVLVVECVIAVIEMLVGPAAYRALGWVDMTWAKLNRAHALFHHPNDLGHFAGLMVLGLVALMAVRTEVPRRIWALLVVICMALAASQSREGVLGVLLGIGLIYRMRRAHGRRLALVAGVIFLTAAVPLIVSPANRAELGRRLAGVTDAILLPSGGACAGQYPGESTDCPDLPDREIRLLYMQQGFTLLIHRPALGYGVGQFGGIVAYQDNPNWNDDPRFQPYGFNRYGFAAKTVDSFWLHLVVETGVIGLVAYLAWLFSLAAPLLRSARRRRGDARAPAHPFLYWAPAALLFIAFVAILSPALEDPLVPPILFTIVGLAWVMYTRGQPGGTGPEVPASVGAEVLRDDGAEAMTTMEKR